MRNNPLKSVCSGLTRPRLLNLPRQVLSFHPSKTPDMFLPTIICLPLIFITAAHALSPPPPNPSINLLNLSLTPSAIQPSNLTVDDIKCDGQKWGYNLIKASCAKAWEQMPTDSEVLTYGARGQGFFERPLPYRYLSGKFRYLYKRLGSRKFGGMLLIIYIYIA